MTAVPARDHRSTVASSAPEADYLTTLALALPVPKPAHAARLLALLTPNVTTGTARRAA